MKNSPEGKKKSKKKTKRIKECEERIKEMNAVPEERVEESIEILGLV